MDRESYLCLKQDEAPVVEYLAQFGSELARPADEQGVQWLTLQARGEVSDVFFARLQWDRYPAAPPSIKFADSIDGAVNNPTSWPNAKGFRPTSLDICRPFSAEGFALHPDWSQTSEAWCADGNPLLFVVECLQDALVTGFEGRYHP